MARNTVLDTGKFFRVSSLASLVNIPSCHMSQPVTLKDGSRKSLVLTSRHDNRYYYVQNINDTILYESLMWTAKCGQVNSAHVTKTRNVIYDTIRYDRRV